METERVHANSFCPLLSSLTVNVETGEISNRFTFSAGSCTQEHETKLNKEKKYETISILLSAKTPLVSQRNAQWKCCIYLFIYLSRISKSYTSSLQMCEFVVQCIRLIQIYCVKIFKSSDVKSVVLFNGVWWV